MANESLDDYLEDFALLIEAGFVAVKQLDEVSATRIFNAAQVMNPMSTAPQIGLGYICLNKLQVREATKIFEGVLERDPKNHLAKTFLGVCFLLTKPKREEGERIIKEVIEESDDPTIKNLGTISLEWAERDLKKIKAPFFSEEVQQKVKESKANPSEVK